MSESLASCPKCGSENVYGVTRVVGYFSRIENWLPSKVSELRDRQKGNYQLTGELGKPLNLNYGEDGVYLIGKEHCSMCTQEGAIVQDAVKKAGLEGKVDVFVKKISNGDGEIIPRNLALAAKLGVSLSSIPAVAIIKDGKLAYKKVTDYNQGMPKLITHEELVEELKKAYSDAA